MTKMPTPRADLLRAQREARYGHLQPTAEDIMRRVMQDPKDRKLIPYAGKESKGIEPDPKKGPRSEARKARDAARKKDKPKSRRKTALPKDSNR